METKLFTVLAEGPSLKAYKDVGGHVIGVNSVYATYKKIKRKKLRLDLLVVMDAPRHLKAAGKYDNIIAMPESIPILFQNRGWESVGEIKRRGNVTIMPMTRVKPGDVRGFWKREVCGSTTAIACIYYAIKQGAAEVRLYGHDFSRDWVSYSDAGAMRTIQELNFAHSILKEKGGRLAVCEESALWAMNFEGVSLECEEISKNEDEKA